MRAFSLRDELASILNRKVEWHVDAVGDSVRIERVRRFNLIDEANVLQLPTRLHLDLPPHSLFVPGHTSKTGAPSRRTSSWLAFSKPTPHERQRSDQLIVGILIRKVEWHVNAVGDRERVVRFRRFNLTDKAANVLPLSTYLDLHPKLVFAFVQAQTSKLRKVVIIMC
jgi:hypothetical protein